MLSIELPRVVPANEYPTALFRSSDEDFFVEEIMGFEPDGQGEHLWLFIEKKGENTAYVARQIARAARVRDFDVGFSGQKDRHAVTRQWFSIYLPKENDFNADKLNSPTLKVLRVERHRQKLRRGSHQANAFRIILRQFSGDEQTALASLKRIEAQGFPNYFGEQRFGRGGANLSRAISYFSGEIKASRDQRGFYLSAARSQIFNLALAARVTDGSWMASPELGPMYGEVKSGVNDLSVAERIGPRERAIFDACSVLCKGLESARMLMEWRSLRVVPQNFSYEIAGDVLSLSFSLPTGSFATALLREVLDYETAVRSVSEVAE
ncbi:MAG: tRNA pseudouridine(13) synthase TruD [Hahellaceae bacterium]|nr:tRNA pseudouridine(13) synthase TruD [Hahellaceae bacterium]